MLIVWVATGELAVAESVVADISAPAPSSLAPSDLGSVSAPSNSSWHFST